jgi:Tfp pilus assembly protein FimT
VKTAGSTLVELSVVIAIFSLITMCTAINTGFLHHLMVRGELEHLCMMCRYLQSKALATHQKQTLNFDLRTNTYTSDGVHYQLPQSITFGVRAGIKGPPATPTKLIKLPMTFKNNQIVFHETGIISAGSAYLVDAQHKHCYALTAAVSPISYIRLYQYTDSWQLLV